MRRTVVSVIGTLLCCKANYSDIKKQWKYYLDKAVEAVERSDLPEKMKQDLINSKKYMIGRSLTFEIKKPDDTKFIMDLINIKLKN
jgi:hypothetical protein